MRVLKLTLKKKWFDMFLSGQKKEEYREIKPYWMQRLTYCYQKGFSPCKYMKCGANDAMCANAFDDSYTHVQFTNGYGNDKPSITFELLDISIGKGDPNLGASNEDVFIVKVGEEINRKNINNG